MPLSTALGGNGRRVSWVPAHCGPESVGRKQLDDGSFLSAGDLAGNDTVDDLAKQAARRDRAPKCQLLRCGRPAAACANSPWHSAPCGTRRQH